MDTLLLLRIGGLALWIAVAIALVPSLYRFVRGRSDQVSEWRAAVFFTSLVMIGGLGRWLIWPDDLEILMGIHACSAALAVFILILSAQGRRK